MFKQSVLLYERSQKGKEMNVHKKAKKGNKYNVRYTPNLLTFVPVYNQTTSQLCYKLEKMPQIKKKR